MSFHNNDAVIVGSGVFEITAGLALGQRGYKVNVFDRDRGPIAHASASSTQLAKLFEFTMVWIICI
jgi:glycine/D-amino acid oxidase-like deaminating enzyme